MYANLPAFANLSLSLSLSTFVSSSTLANPEKRANSRFSRVAAPRRSRHPALARAQPSAKNI